jgi:plasmid stability protein
MKNVTVTLDEETAAWARVHAAQHGMSLSRFLGEVLRERMHGSRAYEEAYRAWQAEKPFDLKRPWKPYPRREELYDRPVLRRR